MTGFGEGRFVWLSNSRPEGSDIPHRAKKADRAIPVPPLLLSYLVSLLEDPNPL